MTRRYLLTAHHPSNTKTLYRAAASTEVEVEHLITNMRRFSGDLHITVQDTETGVVESRRAHH